MDRDDVTPATRAADVVPPGSDVPSEPSEDVPATQVTEESQSDRDPGDETERVVEETHEIHTQREETQPQNPPDSVA